MHQLTSGSPPPMRGKVKSDNMNMRWFRITPAYAGKSSCTPFLVMIQEDHPRLCGEKSLLAVSSAKVMGITPAYAGKS